MSTPGVEQHIGQYRILRTLGAGGMGTVYLGEHLLLGRRAAIKTLLPSLSTHPEIVDRFFNEARAISAISDPGVVSVFDFGYHVDGTAFIVMEFLEGESLAARLDRLTTLRLLDALRLGRQLASSLGAAHDRDIVHRDLKPGNVFLVRDAEVPGGERTKILDFGICKLGDPDNPTTTQTGTMLGTPVYMSPEQCRGAGRVDKRSDIYSLGCVLFHMVTGRPPFDVDSVGDYIAAHLKEPPPVPSSLAPGLPTGVDALLLSCLAKDPELRFQSMTEVQAAIDHVIADVIATASDNDATAEPAPKPRTPLGTGFHSAFDVNLVSNLSARSTPSPRSDPWFVDSRHPLPVIYDDDDEPPRRRGRWGTRIALASALLVGVAGGLAGTSYVLEQHQLEVAAAVEAPPPPDAGTVEPLAPPFVARAHETAPPAPIAASEEEDRESDEARDAVEKKTKPRAKKQGSARATRPKVKKPPRPRVRRELPPAPPREPTPPSPPEDLYDSR